MNKNRNKTNDEDFSVSILKHLNIFFKSSFRQALTAKHTPTRHFNLILYAKTGLLVIVFYSIIPTS